METKTLFAPQAARNREAEKINAHALGVNLAVVPDDDMKRFEVIEKDRLVEQHAAEVAGLNTEIEGWKNHAAALQEKIHGLEKKESKLMLGLGALAMVVAYLYLRDYGCSTPFWTRMWGL